MVGAWHQSHADGPAVTVSTARRTPLNARRLYHGQGRLRHRSKADECRGLSIKYGEDFLGVRGVLKTTL